MGRTLIFLYPTGCNVHRYCLKQDEVLCYHLNVKAQEEALRKKGFQEADILRLFL